ncbi:MAG: ABC transporter ATP-binding protein [Kiritimatiellae bacterium]|nr:ABC transporter ATP-binding protein [Kiritimatiellia bacterium]MCO5068227.1 ABC transporter ATP-binding protein [Kiritimatiellia bacterium]
MSSDYAIEVNQVSKKFARSLKRAMWYGLSDMAAMALVPKRWQSPHREARAADAAREGTSALPLLPPPTDASLRPTEFWALRDVSFRLKPGESLGLLGANGAGKSTMFSILSGIYAPTQGTALYRGRLQALIALGAGFHPSLSGRENVYINAAILGMREKEVDAIYEKIVDFSGIGDFIDAPIKNYSSGMVVRLAFSIAVHLDPDILLIDEVLAVGDAIFQLKCARFARELVSSGKTLIVVSHNMLIVQMMCRRALWLDHGRVMQEGETHPVVQEYQRFMMQKAASEERKTDRSSDARFSAAIVGAEWLDSEGRPCQKLTWGRPHALAIEIDAVQDLDCARLWAQISVVGKEGGLIEVSMFDDGHFVRIRKGRRRLIVRWDAIPLAESNLFQITMGIRDWSGQVMLADSYASPYFEMNPHGLLYQGESQLPSQCRLSSPMIAVPYSWDVSDGVELHHMGDKV